MRRATHILLGIALTVAAPWAAADADYPSKPITMVVPFTAGGGVDTFGRILSEQLQEKLGAPVVVENRPGAGGNIGAAIAAKAKPDGYTLVVVQNGVTINPWLHEEMPFDIEKDLTPVGIYADLPIVVAVTPSLPVKSISDLISYTKEREGEVFYATPGTGTPQHLATELFISMTDAQMEHVPYRGATDLFPDIVTGRSQVMFGVLTSTAPYINNDQLRALATGGAERTVSMFSDLPTIAETVPGYEFSVWFGIMATGGTPQPIIEKVAKALEEAVNVPEVQERMKANGYEPVAVGPESMKQVIQDDLAKWGELTRQIGIAVR